MDVGDLPAHLALAVAALAGAASFLSPCVAPLLPGYVAFLAGGAVPAAGDPAAPPRVPAARAAGFATGFVALFVLLGASATAASRALPDGDVLELAAGLVVALVGVAMLAGRDLLPAGAEAAASRAGGRVTSRLHAPAGALAAAGVGAGFAVAWTPCVGPVLGAIVVMASGTGNPAWGATLLGAYGIGLVAPLLVAGVALGRTRRVVGWLQRRRRAVNRVAGVLLVLAGLAIATGLFEVLGGRLAGLVPALG